MEEIITKKFKLSHYSGDFNKGFKQGHYRGDNYHKTIIKKSLRRKCQQCNNRGVIKRVISGNQGHYGGENLIGC